PLPPTNIAATSVSTSQINLSWTAPSGTINGYKIERSQDNGNTWSTIVANTTTTATTYSDTGLLSNTYYYRISSLSIGGTSNPSTIASATTIPTPPTNLSSSAVSTSQINLSWTAPLGTILGYKIERSTDGIIFSTIIANTTTAATTYSDTGLSSNTLYTYRISSLGLASTISSPSGTTSMTTIPSTPTSLVTTALPNNTIEISWVKPTGPTQILGYKIERSTDGTTWSVLVANNNDGTIYKNTGLTPGQTYYYRVSAINSGGTGSPSAISNITTSGDIPSTMSIPTVTVYSGGIMNVTWNAPSSNSYPITSYKIDYSTNGGASYATVATVTGTPPILHHLVTGLTVGSSYQWRIEAVNSLGTSAAGTSSDASIALPALKIETRSIQGNMTRGAAFSIFPNPNGQSAPYITTDGGVGDSDGINDGTVTVTMIPVGTYDITMTTIPSGYKVL
ncbi:MAG: fibronectin type III domain-containing protein, partial [Patescibacteria group bacterium]|nr:fibronectin type III domain-containing protein [Patescibacteria group bacterium]